MFFLPSSRLLSSPIFSIYSSSYSNCLYLSLSYAPKKPFVMCAMTPHAGTCIFQTAHFWNVKHHHLTCTLVISLNLKQRKWTVCIQLQLSPCTEWQQGARNKGGIISTDNIVKILTSLTIHCWNGTFVRPATLINMSIIVSIGCLMLLFFFCSECWQCECWRW